MFNFGCASNKMGRTISSSSDQMKEYLAERMNLIYYMELIYSNDPDIKDCLSDLYGPIYQGTGKAPYPVVIDRVKNEIVTKAHFQDLFTFQITQKVNEDRSKDIIGCEFIR